jgi:possible phage tail sheath completion protein|nr:MAG TPA: tail connector protein [Caudoviricetes sp.]
MTIEIDCKDFCSPETDDCNKPELKNLSNPRSYLKVEKKLSDSNLEPSWNYADQTFDQDLANQRVDAENAIKRLDRERDNLLSGEKEFCVQKVSKPKNAFNTRIQIGAESTTIELLKYNGLSLGDQNSQNPETTANAENSETKEPELEQLEQHPNTIRKYVAGMLAFFSNLRVEYLANGKVYQRKLPVFYGNREKLLTIEEHEFSELMNGNTNFLPRASLVIDSMTYDQNRQNNKNVAVQRELTMQSLTNKNAFAYVTSAPSPYNIAVRLNLITRGMNDAMMLVEQVASFFNPFYTFKMVEEQQESSIRLQLDSVTFEPPEIDQFSNNEVMVEFGFTLYGNMYKPRSKEYIIDTITLNI